MRTTLTSRECHFVLGTAAVAVSNGIHATPITVQYNIM